MQEEVNENEVGASLDAVCVWTEYIIDLEGVADCQPFFDGMGKWNSSYISIFRFAWHWKTDLNFAFCFSFSPNFKKRIWISYFVFRFRITLKNGYEFCFNFVFHFRITLKNGFEFLFSFSHRFEKRITAPVQSFEVPGHPVGVDQGIHFLCKWKQVNFSLPGAKVSGELPPPPMICLTHTVIPFLTMQWMTNDMMIAAKKHAAIATLA